MFKELAHTPSVSRNDTGTVLAQWCRTFFLTIEDTTVIVASAAGAPKNPDWYANLVAHPDVSVEWWQDGELVTSPVIADVAPEGSERDAMWNRVVQLAPGFGDYQTKTTRVIPLIRLLPRS